MAAGFAFERPEESEPMEVEEPIQVVEPARVPTPSAAEQAAVPTAEQGQARHRVESASVR